MQETGECKGCARKSIMTPEEIYIKYVKPLNLDKKKIVAEEVYNERLSVCMSCEGLYYGTTCRFCGCLVQVRAKLKNSKCPYPYAPKWNK